MPGPDYAQVSLPRSLVEVIDLVVQTNPLAFTSRSEFIRAAIRDYLGRIDEHTQRIDDTLHRVSSGQAMAKLRQHIDDP